jgi:hypothetical protein
MRPLSDQVCRSIGMMLARLSSGNDQTVNSPELEFFKFYKSLGEDDKKAWLLLRLLFFLTIVEGHANVSPRQFELIASVALDELGVAEKLDEFEREYAIVKLILAANERNDGFERFYLVRYFLMAVLWQIKMPPRDLLSLVCHSRTFDVNERLRELGFRYKLPMDPIATNDYCEIMHSYVMAIATLLQGEGVPK